MSLDVPSIKTLRIRPEVEEGVYEPAIDLARIARGTAPRFILDPVEFFKRTHVTPAMRMLIVKTLMGLLGKTRLRLGGGEYVMYNKLLVLPSLFGGGKSHSLATLYHIVNVVRRADSPDKARAIISVLDEEIAEFIYRNWNDLKNMGINVVVVDCGESEFAPVPEDNRHVKTLWGYIAQQLGRYHLIARYDRAGTAPPKDVLKILLDGSGAVILIDEIARYYSRTRALSRDVINTFLMNLSEALTTEEVSRCVVVIAVPYDVERGVVEEAHAETLKPEVIKRILDRVGSGNTIPVVTTVDLPSILRKRILEVDEDALREYGRRLADAIYDNAVEIARQIIERRGGRKRLREELEKTYPFHPETITVLRLLHMYLSKYIQATRNPIRLASEAIIAVKRGLYNWLGYEPYLVMPFHIPIVLERVLAESFPLSFSEYRVFREILLRDVVHPVREIGEEVRLGDNIAEKMPKELHVPSYMVAAYVWLRSLAGGGLLSRSDAYPTEQDIAFALVDYETVRNPEWVDVSAILRSLHGKLTYLATHGGRWLFRRIPDIWQLIERYARDILPNQVYNELSVFFDNIRLSGEERRRRTRTGVRSTYRIRVLRDAQVYLVGYGEEARLPDDLDVNKPTIVVFTREADDEEVERVLARNNIVVLRPDTERGILDEDRAVKPELNRYKTYWEALLEALRYLVACRRITKEVLKQEYIEELERSRELFTVLEAKKDQYENDFRELVSFLIPRVYHSVLIKRAGRVIQLEGLTIRPDAPLEYCVEVVLENSGYLKEVLRGSELEALVRDYLKRDMRERREGIEISDIWNFLLYSDAVEKIPVTTYEALMNAVYELVRGLDYGVKVGSRVYWKKLYSTRQEAIDVIEINGRDTGEETVKELEKLMASLRRRGEAESVRLVYWEHLVEPWLESVRPEKGRRIAVVKPTKEVVSLDELRNTYNWEEVLKDSAVFLEELKVSIELGLPDTVRRGEEIRATLTITSGTYRGRVRVEVDSPHIEVSEREFEAELPVSRELTLAIPEETVERTLQVTVVVYSDEGEELERYTRSLRLWEPTPRAVSEGWFKKRGVLRLLEEGRLKSVRAIRSKKLGDLATLPQLVSCPAEVKIRVRVKRVADADKAIAEFTVENLPLDRAPRVHNVIARVADLGEGDVDLEVRFDKPLGSDELSDNIELHDLPDDVELRVEYEADSGV